MKISNARLAMLTAAGVAILLLASGGLLHSQSGTKRSEARSSDPHSGTASHGYASQDPARFLDEQYQCGLLELKMGDLAIRQASKLEVKHYAETLRKDHQGMNQKLLQLAEKKEIPLAQQLASQHEQMLKRLSQMQGTNFDQAYLHESAKQQMQIRKSLANMAQNGTDSDLREFAKPHLLVIANHIEQVREIGATFDSQIPSHEHPEVDVKN